MAAQFVVFVLALTAATVICSVVPTPANWGEDEVVDVGVKVVATWHPILGGGSWTLSEPVVTTHESNLLSFRALFSNALSITSDSEHVRIALLTADGLAVAEEIERTGRGGIFGAEKTIGATLRKVPYGTYTLSIGIVDDDGSVRAQNTRELRIIPEESS